MRQKNYVEKTEIARGSKAQLAAEAAMDPSMPVEWIPLGGETCILIGSKPMAKVYNAKNAKPSILSVLIYSYSRALLWKTLLQHNCIYSDTDSGIFRVPDYLAIRASLPALNPEGRTKALGDLEEELGEHATARAYLIAPKDYAVFLFDKDGKPPTKKGVANIGKLRMKGVNQRSDRLLLKALPDLSVEALAAEYHGEAITEEDAEPISVALSEDPESFFRERARGNTVQVLCSQLTRSYREREDEPFALRQRYLIKTIEGKCTPIEPIDFSDLMEELLG